MISLSAPTYDTAGSLVSSTGYATLQSAGRRSSRVATLDGGAVLVDGGWSDADRTYLITVSVDARSAHETILWLMQYHATAILSCDQGCFSVLLSGLAFRNGKTTVTVDVLEVL